MRLNLKFMGTRWFILLVVFAIPAALLAIALAYNASICIVMVLLVWILVALMVFYLPRFQDEPEKK